MESEPNALTKSPIDRRGFLASVVSGVGVSALASRAEAEAPIARADSSSPASFPGLVTREREPKNLEFPFPTLDSPVVPTNRFFVRGHFAIPKLDAAIWRLQVDGEVQRPLSLSYDELRALPSRTFTATMECAGNSRIFLMPKPKGVLWELGGIGNAEWTGVSLATILEKAGVKENAVEVILEGSDSGQLDDPKSPGPIRFERSLPLDKARRPEVILAYAMNGKDLTPEHGYPVRAVVSGWYGMASVKWLSRLSVTAQPFNGFWQTTEYSYWKRDAHGGRPSMVPLTEMQVKSSIARPAFHEVVPAGVSYRVHGAAWAGEADVTKVDVSTDGGKTWNAARLLGDSVPFSWRLWEYDWNSPDKPGACRLMSRATDSRGRTQGDAHTPDKRAYMINHVLPIDVEVR